MLLLYHGALLLDPGCSVVGHSPLLFNQDNYAIVAQGYQVLLEKNDSEMNHV